MDSDQGKLFIGGISWETTEDKLKDYFGQFGDVIQAVIMRDKLTGRPRGFGFVVFSDPASVDSVLQDKHTIDGRTVSPINPPLYFLGFGFCGYSFVFFQDSSFTLILEIRVFCNTNSDSFIVLV